MPVENTDALFEEIVEIQGEKFNREIHDKNHGHTNAIQTEDERVQIFQHQQARDEALLWATIDKRIRISSKENNEKEFLLAKDIGDVLFFNYQKAMGLPSDPIPFDQDLWKHCQAQVQATYLSKPMHALMNGQLRQSPDFPENKIALFLKSQWVNKTEKMGTLVKAGQTIASFMQETVMIYGTMARYMRFMRRTFQPNHVFINCETDEKQLSQFVKEKWDFTGPATSNDYTSFDQSQDGAMLQFEVMKAKHHCIPEEVIQGYIYIKENAQIFLGTLAIMRLSGEGPTFDANTECSIAFLHTKYSIPPTMPQVFAGDDSAICGAPDIKPSFTSIVLRLALVEKPVKHKQRKGDWPTFCGNLLTPLGVVKDPFKLLAGWELGKRTGRLKDLCTSYALDAKLAYQLQDGLYDIFNEPQMAAHFGVIRDIHMEAKGHLLL